VVLALGALAGCGSKAPAGLEAILAEGRATVAEVIPDSARANRILSEFRALGTAFSDSAASQKEWVADFSGRYRDYDATRAELDRLVLRQHDSARGLREEAFHRRDAVRALTSADEWKRLGAERKRLASLYGGNP